jgi:nucleotide-binding universal stress UspA family protein
MVKDIVVNLSGTTAQDFAADYTLSVAKSFDARVSGIAFAYAPVIPDTVFGGIPTDVIEIQRQENERAANAAGARFEAAAQKAAVTAETRVLEVAGGGAPALFARIARHFDLAVIGQAGRDGGAAQALMIEAALFDSGRPLIVVPFIQKQGLALERVLACWDGGRTAARAIGDAMPFLTRAKAVELVIVAEPSKDDEAAGASMAAHLSRKGVAVEVKRIAKGDIDVRDAILSHAADCGADFIVMGGYGHSRLREFMLGGVTRGMLASMTAPVLMSH